jgi:DNA polymerase III subunit epsilon
MTAWWSGHAVGLDFESDSPTPEEARIITCNITNIAPGEKPFSLDWLVKPERDIPQGAIDVHGITTEHAQEFGMPRGDAVADIVSMLTGASESVPVVGHNVGSYDLTLLDREMRRLGLGSLGLDEGLVTIRRDGRTQARFPVIDTLVLDKAVDPYRPGKGGRRLEKVAEQYGVPMAEGAAHAADADVLASLRIAWKIANMCDWEPTQLHARYASRSRSSGIVVAFNGLAGMSLIDLHHLQAKWAVAQAEGLRQYFRDHPERGVDPNDIDGSWPFHPYV